MSALALFVCEDAGGRPSRPLAQGGWRTGEPRRPPAPDCSPLIRGWARDHPFEAEALFARLGLSPAAAAAAFTEARARFHSHGA
ncbi:hypothetical protein [Hansschlegelia zhihuaiae]|uniref:Uncharacterized protein n=1 Tax=Hansschlegelia zhihuaiae TaxID=405005 RepID=A0A4Q0MFL3_9HYPH|nr:hypothetical protein [Hansschlegelia zhihuaiae]RXF72084.1 hypothetical protein EK403_14845 [Hansschlegelia zhihuaiae]